VYCTQFHPELDADGLFRRFAAYPRYAEYVAGVTLAELAATVEATPQAGQLVRRFVEMYAGQKAAVRPRAPSAPAP